MRELEAAGVVKVTYVPTALNRADVLTKVLPRPVFEEHTAVLMGHATHQEDGSSLTEGGVDG